ncbi:Serralysin C precursor [Prochlorococcus marinus str. MIT 1342]|nr:Serralysin C precursor [Prochlorococcus marinus str. MIT 1342]
MKDLNSFGGTFDGLSALDYHKFIDFLNAAAKEINPFDPESVTLSIYEAPFLPMSWIDQKVPNSWDAEVIEGSNDVEDTLNAGNGSQTLMGLMLDDILIGGSGSDFLVGGEGADTFQFNTKGESQTDHRRDVITDFNGEEGDVVHLSNIEENLVYIGSDTFSVSQDEVRFEDGLLQLNLNQGLDPDMVIELSGVTSFSSDFLV